MDAALIGQLERSRALGFLGPGPVEEHVHHAAGFLAALEDVTGRVIDLGSGGGVPGLVVAVTRTDLQLVLIDAMAKRCRFLQEAVLALGLSQTRVVHGRAEVLGRGHLRGTAAAVLARSFGPPAVTAECGAPFLRIGGRLVVSEPPDTADRWPKDGLARLGLRIGGRTATTPIMQELIQITACPAAYPRRDGRPGKRPLF